MEGHGQRMMEELESLFCCGVLELHGIQRRLHAGTSPILHENVVVMSEVARWKLQELGKGKSQEQCDDRQTRSLRRVGMI